MFLIMFRIVGRIFRFLLLLNCKVNIVPMFRSTFWHHKELRLTTRPCCPGAPTSQESFQIPFPSQKSFNLIIKETKMQKHIQETMETQMGQFASIFPCSDLCGLRRILWAMRKASKIWPVPGQMNPYEPILVPDFSMWASVGPLDLMVLRGLHSLRHPE